MAGMGNPKYVVQYGLVILDTKTITKLVPVSFMFNNYWIKLDPEDYLIDITTANDGSALMLMFLQNSYEFYIFGQPIMQNYYMTFSMENSTMTVIPNAWTTKKPLQLGTIPTTLLSETKARNPLLNQIIGIVFLAAMAALYYFLLGPFVQKKVTNNTYIYGF